MENQRNYFRYTFLQPVEATFTIESVNNRKLQENVNPMKILDAGPTGLRILAQVKMTVREDVLYSFDFTLDGQRYVVPGKVVWQGFVDNGYAYGVHFFNDEEREKSLFRVLNQIMIRNKKEFLK